MLFEVREPGQWDWVVLTDEVFFEAVETQDVAALFVAMLGEYSRYGLEHVLHGPVARGAEQLVDQNFVQVNGLLEDAYVILKCKSDESVTVITHVSGLWKWGCGKHVPVTACLLQLVGDVSHVSDPHGVRSVARNGKEFVESGRPLDGLGVLVGIDNDRLIGQR